MDPAVKPQDDDVISKSLAFSRLKFHIYQSECSMNRAKKEQALKVLAILYFVIQNNGSVSTYCSGFAYPVE